MPYTPIIGTLGYLLDAGRTQVLLVRRDARPEDQQYGKVNGLGGKLEADEDVLTGLRREFREEAGIELHGVELRGTVSWPGFGPHGEDWLGFVFLADGYSGELAHSNEEGAIGWYPLDELLNGSLPMWDGDRHFLPLVFDRDPRPFHGIMPYANGTSVSWSYAR